MLTSDTPHPNVIEYNPSIREVALKYLEYMKWIKDNGIDSTADVLAEIKAMTRVMFNYAHSIDPMDFLDTAFWNKLLNPVPGVVGEFHDYGIGLSHRVEKSTYYFAVLAMELRMEFELTFDWPEQAVKDTGVEATAVN